MTSCPQFVLTRSFHTCVALLILGVNGQTRAAEDVPASPAAELATFQLDPAFRIELVAAEPLVVDPVAMAFDEAGELYVAEMRGYPNGGVGTGEISSGVVKKLFDDNHDGRYDRATVFADKLRFPTSICPWNGGVFVAVAPDLWWMKDTDGDGAADIREVVYTGFDVANIQSLLNSLQWGIDHRIYGCAGYYGGEIRSPHSPAFGPLALRGRGIRFSPSAPGSLEPTTGGGQFGLTADDAQRWFTATNGQHLLQVVLPDQYLQRNPFLPASRATREIADHGAAAKVFRISPFEAWRVERTTRRVNSEMVKRLASTEQVAGGYFTSACSPLVYTAELFPQAYHGNNFVCDPANNLIHREELYGPGPVYRARRITDETEFLASTDNWFRPTALTLGPDGAMYICDFYREAIETPLSLTPDLLARMNLSSRAAGRIWRVAPKQETAESKAATAASNLGQLSSQQLVKLLNDGNSWRRLTAQRLLVERNANDVAASLVTLASTASRPAGRATALWTLDGLNSLDPDHVVRALSDLSPTVRQHALRLAERFLKSADKPSQMLLAAVIDRADDESPDVSFQAALTFGDLPTNVRTEALARCLATSDYADPIDTAALSSALPIADALFEQLLEVQSRTEPLDAFQGKLAGMIATAGNESSLVPILNWLARNLDQEASWASLESVLRGYRAGGRSLSALWTEPTAGLAGSVTELRAQLEARLPTRLAQSAGTATAAQAISLVALTPPDLAIYLLAPLLSPQSPRDQQVLSIRALGQMSDSRITTVLVNAWQRTDPTVRGEILEILMTTADRQLALLDAVEGGEIAPLEVDAAKTERLKQHVTPSVKDRAQKLLVTSTADRQQVVQTYASADVSTANVERGQAVFRKQCVNCHRLDGVGHNVGPDLMSQARGKDGPYLLNAIFDPNKEVDARYLAYVVVMNDGQTISGIISEETPTALTVKRGEGAAETLLRTQIDSIQATSKSLMPEGFERQLTPGDAADVIAYIRDVTK